MTAPSLAHPGHETTTRVERAAKLFEEHFERFAYAGGGVYLVPSGTEATSVYEVSLRGGERCECADFEHRGGRCKHIIALRIFKAKTGTCAGCGERHRHEEMVEVPEGHEIHTSRARSCAALAPAARASSNPATVAGFSMNAKARGPPARPKPRVEGRTRVRP
ncbi:MAG: SWIM zinc finger domain-containing protein [Actinomycetota bacterium]|nr:SWIM zinc finger domain-containing protein [Actinomycetota bacterium]